jgi:hypothetical protein
MENVKDKDNVVQKGWLKSTRAECPERVCFLQLVKRS